MALPGKRARDRESPYLLRRGIETPPSGLNRRFRQALRELEAYPSADSTEAFTEGEVDALHRGGIDVRDPWRGPDLVALSRARYAALLERALSPEEVADRLGITPGRVRQLLGERRLLGVLVEGRWRDPDFQLAPLARGRAPPVRRRTAKRASYRLIHGLDQVVPTFPEATQLLTVHRWLTTPKHQLRIEGPDRDTPVELSPIEWLEHGRPPEPVAQLARDLAF